MAMPLTNASFANLILRECVGVGGAAEVWRAEHKDDHRPYAVKVLKADRAREKHHLRAFLREIEVMGEIKHPAIPVLRNHGQIEGLPAFAMDYVPGYNLAIMLGKGARFPSLRALVELVEAIAYLHRNDIVHNDIKLENAIWRWDGKNPGRLILVDFGNIRKIGKLSPISSFFYRSPSKIFGTASYLAPELIEGKKATKLTDIYAVGVCAFILLSGKLPFDRAATESSRIRANAKVAPPNICLRLKGVPPPVGKIIDDCLAKDPAARTADIEQVLGAVKSLVGKLPEQPYITGSGNIPPVVSQEP